jgi:hypothetical protein
MQTLALSREVAHSSPINGSKWVLFFSGVETEKNIVAVLFAQEVAGQIQLTLCQIRSWLECLKRPPILRTEDQDWFGRIDIHLGKESLEHLADTLKLIQDMAGLSLVRIGEYCCTRSNTIADLFVGVI